MSAIDPRTIHHGVLEVTVVENGVQKVHGGASGVTLMMASVVAIASLTKRGVVDSQVELINYDSDAGKLIVRKKN